MSRREWDLVARPYDLLQQALEPRVLRGTRRWIASQACGRTLEVAIGSGLTLAHYPWEVRLTGLDLSPRMLRLARRRADTIGRTVDLRVCDAQALPWDEAWFDTVVCVFGLCAVPDERTALAEMARVLRPGGLLLLADHVESTRLAPRAVQAAMDTVRLPLPGEHWSRRPLPLVLDNGFVIEAHDRFLAGVVERLAARRPAGPPRREDDDVRERASLWFLDVDRVLNTVPRRRSGPPDSDSWDDWTSGSATVDGMAWLIWFSPGLMAGISSLHRAGLVDIHWLTTWGTRRTTGSVASLRLPAFAVAGTSPDRAVPGEAAGGTAGATHGEVAGHAAPDLLTATWWKFDVVRAIAADRPDRRIVWTDDDPCAVPHVQDWMRGHTTCLLVAPDMHEGLTPADLEAVRRFAG